MSKVICFAAGFLKQRREAAVYALEQELKALDRKPEIFPSFLQHMALRSKEADELRAAIYQHSSDCPICARSDSQGLELRSA